VTERATEKALSTEADVARKPRTLRTTVVKCLSSAGVRRGGLSEIVFVMGDRLRISARS
jgi:hypothetical protein